MSATDQQLSATCRTLEQVSQQFLSWNPALIVNLKRNLEKKPQ